MAASLFAKELLVNAVSTYQMVEQEDKELENAQFALDDYQNFLEGQEVEEEEGDIQVSPGK